MHPSRLLALVGLLCCSAMPPVRADSAMASCSLSRQGRSAAVETGPCLFSQRQGNATVLFGGRTFRFLAGEPERALRRGASDGGLTFQRPGAYTLQVRWAMAERPAADAKPPGWAGDNPFLGRWLGESRAGRAVFEVLTLEPERIRWGNSANGRCDRDYSVTFPSAGHDGGHHPDRRPWPGSARERRSGVVRLTLQPGPCATGDAALQLNLTGDSSAGLEVESYGADGRLIGQYGVFSRLPAAAVTGSLPDTRATVLSIDDGDTIRVRRAGRPLTVRLACIDAPEMAQSPWGAGARRYLQQRLPTGTEVRLDVKTTDSRGLTVAEVISEININLVLVEDGQAFADRRAAAGCHAREYLDAEFRASRHRYGIWQVEGGITRPWEFRRRSPRS